MDATTRPRRRGHAMTKALAAPAAITALAATLAGAPAHAANTTAYAEWTEATRTLTFRRGPAPKAGDTDKDGQKIDKVWPASLTQTGDDIWRGRAWSDIQSKATTVTFADSIRPDTTSGWFRDMPNLTRVEHADRLDTSHVKYMSWMFDGASSLTLLDVSRWDTHSVASMRSMFDGASSLTSLDVSGWDVSNVTNMDGMFSETSSLESLDVSRWDTHSVTSMGFMFSGASSLTSLDVSKWDTSNVTGMFGTFFGASSLESLDVSRWDTHNVTTMWETFAGASSLTSLDVSKWDTSNVTDMRNMFQGASSLTFLDMSGWDTSKVTDMSWMLGNNPRLAVVSVGKGFVTPKGDKGRLGLPSGTDGKWWSSPSRGYAPSDIPWGTAVSWHRQRDGGGLFDDVTFATPHQGDIEWLAGRRVTTGWANGTGLPDYRGMASVTRQDMAAFLYRLAGSPAFDPATMANPFDDVTSATPHHKEIIWLATNGITTGWKNPDGTRSFRGMASVVRQDMAAFLHRWADMRDAAPTLGQGVTFTDLEGASHVDDIQWLAATGITTGWKNPDGHTAQYRGMNDVTRQDMAAFLHRLHDATNTR